MKTKVLVILALLIGIGVVLHTVIPPILFGMKPDMMLSMMFLGIMLFPKKQYVALLAIATGILSALTTLAPGGQVANMIDKPITAFVFFGLFLLIQKHISGIIYAPILTGIGTIISGSIFIGSALYIVGLMDGAFTALFLTIVIPTAIINAIVMVVVYPVVERIMKRSQVSTI